MSTKPGIIDVMSTIAGISTEQSEQVFNLYVKNKVLKATASHGYEIKHGKFYDKPTILHALSVAQIGS
jgi:hypothetical protein